jgi:hypothetical protein
MNSVFISYSSKDRAFATRLASDLKAKGLRVWFDQWELKVGDSLISKISSGVSSNDYLVVVLSKSSIASEWVRKELNAALMRELTEKRVVVLPVLIENCQIPPFLSDKVYADFRGDYISGLNRLLDGFPGTVFVSGMDLRTQKSLAQNVYTKNILTTNVLDKVLES